MYDSIRKELGSKQWWSSETDRLCLDNLFSIDAVIEKLNKLTGKGAVVIRAKVDTKENFINADFKCITVGKINPINCRMTDHMLFGEELYDLLDVVPTESLKEGGELKAYTFYGHNIPDGDEHVMAIHDNPAAAFLTALTKSVSKTLKLKQIEEIKPGLAFRSENHYDAC